MAARLKVYQASFGFHESVVAAANQKAALDAWGARQNLFAEGLACVTDDPGAAKAALAHPGVPFSRPIGSASPFALDSSELPKIPAAAKRKSTGGPRAASRAKPARPQKPAPDRGPLDAAEDALGDFQARARAVEDDFHTRLRRLERERAAALEDADAQVAAARKEVERARRAYRDAGGSD
ncbi:MAG TPA: cell envelope biogenesis protein TolA [Caulobacteraceae bacterium]|nr:cell envelope biogenesis protein TolA [Caulobacteraceae bacterium]